MAEELQSWPTLLASARMLAASATMQDLCFRTRRVGEFEYEYRFTEYEYRFTEDEYERTYKHWSPPRSGERSYASS